MVQNKFHYAITGQTAAEIVYNKADHTKEHMGLTTWKNAPEGRVLKSDVSVAKNYLSEKQIRQLERTVSGYFDYIEDLIERENTFTMEQFASSICHSGVMIFCRIKEKFLLGRPKRRLRQSMSCSIRRRKLCLILIRQ